MSVPPIHHGPGSGQGPLPLVVGVAANPSLTFDAAFQRDFIALVRSIRRTCPCAPLLLLVQPRSSAEFQAIEAVRQIEGDGFRLVLVLPTSVEDHARGLPAAERAQFQGLAKAAEHVVETVYTTAFLARNSHVLVRLGDRHPDLDQLAAWREDGGHDPWAPPDSAQVPGSFGAIVDLRPREDPEWYRWPATRDWLRWLNRFNRDAHLREKLQLQLDTNKKYLLKDEDVAGLSQPLSDTIRALREWYGLADTLAQHYQKIAHRMLWVLLAISFLALYFLKVMLFAPGEEPWARLGAKIAGSLSGGLLLLNWWWQPRLRHLEYRVLAEGLRVQIFWRLGGLRTVAAEGYPEVHRDHLEWVLLALRSAVIAAERLPIDRPDATLPGGDLVERCWVVDQRDWFRKTAERERQRLLRHQTFLQTAWWFGAAWTVISTLALWTEWYPSPLKWLADQASVPKGFEPSLKLVDVFLGPGLIVLGGLVLSYKRFFNPRKHATRYEVMRRAFALGLERFQRAAPNVAKQQEVLLDLGQRALVEQGDWLSINRQPRVESAPT